MSLIVELWIGWIPMLSQNLFVKSRWHRCLRVAWIIMLSSFISTDRANRLGMCLLILLSYHFVAISLFRSIFWSAMFKVFMALNSTIFIEHILRWSFIHNKSITSFFIFRCLSFGVFFRVRVVLLYILYNTLIILSKALHIVIITLLYKCLVDGQFIVTLSVCFLVQIEAALSIDSRARLRLLLALYLDLLWLCRIDCKR